MCSHFSLEVFSPSGLVVLKLCARYFKCIYLMYLFSQGVFTVWEESPEMKTTSRGHQRQIFLFKECIVLCKLKKDTNLNRDTYSFKNKMKASFTVLCNLI